MYSRCAHPNLGHLDAISEGVPWTHPRACHLLYQLLLTFTSPEVLEIACCYGKATVSLDGGAEVRRTGLIPLRLRDAWMFGAGAAMLASRKVLMTTGGFKDKLGAGLRDGGTEDSEFLWNASRHTIIEYCGHIAVLHEGAANVSILARKIREYGRAIGHLDGMSRSVDGLR